MDHPWHDLPAGPQPPDRLNVYIEIPRGSRNKIELDKDLGVLRFDRLLYSAVHYPGDYGFVPRTLAGDDDPIDVLVMVTEATFPGCLVEVRPVGMFEMADEKGPDEKVLAVPVRDPLYADIRKLDDVPPHYLREVEHFFRIYKELEDVETDVRGWRDVDAAATVVMDACRRYREQIAPGRAR